MTNTVILPLLEQIIISGVPLYQSEVPLKFKSGLNAILGANGLGKTTTIKLAMIGILGKTARDGTVESIVADSESTDEPTVSVVFVVGRQMFQVLRCLRTYQVLVFRHVDEDGVVTEIERTSPEVDDVYVDMLVAGTKCGSEKNLYFLISRLMFREEEATHLLWDVSVQHKILRLLFSGGDFDRTWEESFLAARNADTKYRQHKEFLRRDVQARARIADRLNGTRTQLGRVLAAVGPGNRSLFDIRGDIDRTQKQKADLESAISRLNEEADTIRAERVDSAVAHGEANAELTTLEASLHESVFREYSVLGMAARRLRRQNLCLFCHQTVDEHRKEVLFKTKLSEHECPFCEQVLKVNDNTVHDAHYLAALAKKEHELAEAVTECDKRLSSIGRKIAGLREQLASVDGDLQRFNAEFVSFSDASPGGNAAELETQLDHLSATLGRFDQDRQEEVRLLDTYAASRKTEREALDGLQSDLEEELGKQEALFADVFNQYAERLIGRKVPLERRKAKPKGQQFNYVVFLPVLDRKTRYISAQTATHERFLLDYAFRMAALSFYSMQSGFPAFFAIEPNEGPMDPVYAEHLAKTLSDFAADPLGHTLVVITNLRSIEFLRTVYGKLSLVERLDRTTNFLDFGILKGHQELEKGKYREVWDELFKE